MADAKGEPGEVVGGRYRILRSLAAGGMGEVFEAEHLELGRKVALKRMLRALTRSEEMLRRFENEARAAARIGHPGIVDVIDLGRDELGTYIVMELLDGEELEQRIKRSGPLPIDTAVAIGKEMADAVAAAHDAGIIHRDLKPANVFLCKGRGTHPRIKLLDFGIAKLLFDDSDAQTRTGAVLGTPLYMAPEQLRDSKKVDARADVYSIGAILYFALTGEPPLDAASLPELAFKVTTESPPLSSTKRPEIPGWLDDLLVQALQKDPGARLQSMQAFLSALEEQGLSTSGTVAMPSEMPPATTPPPSASSSAGEHSGSRSAAAKARSAPQTTAKAPKRWPWLVGAAVLGVGGVGVWRLSAAPVPTAKSELPTQDPRPAARPAPEPQPTVAPAPPSATPPASATLAPDAAVVQTPAPAPRVHRPKPKPESPSKQPPALVPR